MPRNMLNWGAAHLGRLQADHASEEVDLRRGDSVVSVSAVIGRSEFETTDTEGLTTATQSRDFILDAADYDFGDGAVTPKAGDQFFQGGIDAGRCYEVMQLPGQPCWRWADDFHTRLRVHTKYIGLAADIDD